MKYGITTGNLLTFRDQAEQDVADVPASFWQGMGAAFEDSFIGSQGPLAYRNVRRGFVEGGGNEDEFASRVIGSIAAPAIMADTLRTAIRGWTNPQGPMLSAEEANDRFAIGDLKFDGPVSLYRAMDLNQTQKNMLRRQDIVNRSQIGFFPQFVAGLGGAALDPVNIAASVLPGGILARTGLALGSSRAATLGMRAAYGATEGALGAAILAPGTYALSAAEARPYSVADMLIDVAFGTALGAGLHAGIGAFHNWRKGKGQMPLISQAVEDATYETKVQLARGAVADVIEGRPVNVAPVVDEIVAYHGSPHKFDAFRLSDETISTGEGAQAFGHGLYFAESEAVARRYQKELTQMRTGAARRALAADGDVDAAIAKANAEIERLNAIPNAGGDVARRDSMVAIQRQKIEELTKLKETGSMSEGQMYAVRINANKDAMLDWDARYADQPERVKAAVDALLADDPVFRAWKTNGAIDRITGNLLYDRISGPQGMARGNAAGQQAASAALREAGIPGIKYLDAGSRDAGEGSRNYVIFDDSLVGITARNGQPLNLKTARADIARSKLDPWTDPEFKQASTEATQAIEAADTPIKARSEDQGIGSDLPEIREMDRVIEQTDQDLKAMEQLGTLSEADKASLKEADEMVKKAEERGKMRDLAAICLSGAGA